MSFIFLSLILHILFLAFTIRVFYPLRFEQQPLLFFDLFSRPFAFEWYLSPVFSMVNIFLLFLISRKYFKRNAYLPSLLYALSPWVIYLSALGSVYIFLLMLLLCFTCGFIYKSGSTMIISAVVLFYTHILSLIFLLPLIFFKNKKIIYIFLIPLAVLLILNREGTKNLLVRDVRIYSDASISSKVNKFQGESKKEGFDKLTRLAENKYIYHLKYAALKATYLLSPINYFSAQFKLLGFSINPPFFAGFLIPFLYGLYLLLKDLKKYSYLLLPLVLLIPAFLSGQMFDLNRLILFSPVVIFITSYGILKLGKRSRLALAFCLVLVSVQFLLFLSDLHIREFARFEITKNPTGFYYIKQ